LIERGVAVDVRALEPGWRAYLGDVLAEATLAVPEMAQRPGGGRRGIHTEVMGYLLAEMQHLHRSHPSARW
jgi:ring-1,2-phenylacetyl-CoA epoxidase subunit PaaC